MDKYNSVFKEELKKYKLSQSDQIKKWYFLERLHILSQLSLQKHLLVHSLMLYEALYEKNIRESLGQFIRLLLVIPGHMFHRLPLGNVGTTRVSAFVNMDIPQEFRELFN